MVKPLSPLTQDICDVASDAMSNALDIDVGVPELARAAALELEQQLDVILCDEAKRIVSILGSPGTALSLTFSSSGRCFAGFNSGPSLMADTLPEVLAKAEEYALAHRKMTAADLGLVA